ncbi:MAG: response regulator [Chitinophagaceae bacterium]|uniref:response regulator transcription factor n=1 Tax=unclassified Paraflavitalea TaxID=2798305 RepID=UPI003D34A0A9|nr:response regulator [Chitinophagaceae bacterium]
MSVKANTTIFLVDDDPMCGFMYMNFFTNQGFTNVSFFSSGKAMLEQIDENPFMVFADYNLSDCTGLELVQKVRSMNPSVYVTIVTGDQDENIKERVLLEGAHGFLLKNDTVTADMLNVIESLLSQ